MLWHALVHLFGLTVLCDPQKFVFEETGIAAYLLALWATSQFGAKSQTFVDLGCGNGFLTYLLTMEGHVGKGIDRQKRKIWDIYDGDPSLVVEDIDCRSCVYPGVHTYTHARTHARTHAHTAFIC